MNQFDALMAQVAEEIRSLGIPISGRIDPRVAVNRRAVTRFGCCRREPGGGYRIELAAALLEADERLCRQTLAHELLHTCPGCRNHGDLWRSYARRMNAAFGYAVARTGSREELGAEPPRPAPYLVVCRRCGREFRRFRASALVQHPERYRCGCGGMLDRMA